VAIGLDSQSAWTSWTRNCLRQCPVAGSKPTPAQPTKTKKISAADRRAAQRAQIETELAQAWSAAREAADARDEAAAAASAAGTAYDDARARVTALKDELRSVQDLVRPGPADAGECALISEERMEPA